LAFSEGRTFSWEKGKQTEQFDVGRNPGKKNVLLRSPERRYERSRKKGARPYHVCEKKVLSQFHTSKNGKEKDLLADEKRETSYSVPGESLIPAKIGRGRNPSYQGAIKELCPSARKLKEKK